MPTSPDLAWAQQLPGTDPAAMVTLVLLSRVARLWESTLEQQVRDQDLQTSEFRILTALLLADAEHLSVSRLNDTVVISQGGVTKAVNRLVRMGLVVKATAPTDRRSVLVRLSAAGRRRTTDLLRVVSAAFDVQMAGLTTEQRADVASALTLLLATFPGPHQLGPRPASGHERREPRAPSSRGRRPGGAQP